MTEGESGNVDRNLELMSKTLRAKDLAVPGRELLVDSDALGAKLQIVSSATMQRLDYHMVVCSDVLLFVHAKKRTTFGRRSSSKENMCISLRDLRVSSDENINVVELSCMPPTNQPPGTLSVNATRYMGERSTLRIFCDTSKSTAAVHHAITDAAEDFVKAHATEQDVTLGSSAPNVPPRPKSFRRIAKEVQYKNSVSRAMQQSNIQESSSMLMEATQSTSTSVKSSSSGPPPPPARTTRQAESIRQAEEEQKDSSSSPTNNKNLIQSVRSMSLSCGSPDSLDFVAYSDQVQSLSEIFDKLANLASTETRSSCTSLIEALREVVITEAKYVDDLRVLVEMYMRPLEQQATQATSASGEAVDDEVQQRGNAYMTMAEIQSIFNFVVPIAKVNTELLQRIHTQLISTFQELEAESNPIVWAMSISNIYAKEFGHIVPFFKMYSTYCHQYTGALGRLSMLRDRSKGLNAFLDDLESRPENQQYSLSSLLIKPVQRICKYPLLFRELLKHTEKIELGPEHIECIKELEQAKIKVEQIAATVNSKVSDRENQDQVLDIFNELVGDQCADLVSPSRRFEHSAEVDISDQPHTERKAGKVYIFNDLVIVAKFTGNGGLALMNNALGKSKRQQLKILGYETITGRCKLSFMAQYDDDKSGKVCLRFTKSACRFWLWCCNASEAQKLAGSFENVKNAVQSVEDTKWEKKTNTRSWTRSLRRSRTSTGGPTDPTMMDDQHPSTDISTASVTAEVAATENVQSTETEIATTQSGKSNSDESPATTPKRSKRGSRRGTMSLDQLRSRYEVSRPASLPDNGLLEFSVTFQDGPLGIALENGVECPGVLVSLVAGTSVAEKGGVCVGDRVTMVGDVAVSKTDTWSQVVEVIKSKQRPLELFFERTPDTVAFGEKKLRFESLMSKLTYGMKPEVGLDPNRGQSLESVKNETLEKFDQVLLLLEEEASRNDMTEPQRDALGIRVVGLLRELFTTEFEHIQSLRELLSGYLLPIRQHRLREAGDKAAMSNPKSASLASPSRNSVPVPLVSEEDENTIFLNMEMLFKTNAELFKLWNETLLDTDEQPTIATLCKALAHSFCQVVPFLVKAHCHYCARYTLALDTLTKLRQCDKDFDAFVVEQEGNGVGGDLLPMVLLKPVHRISRYSNLFSMLGNALADWSGDSSQPQWKQECLDANKAALTLAQDCNQQIEEKIVAAENLERVNEIYRELGADEGASCCADLLGPHTVYIRSEEIELQTTPFADDNPTFLSRMHIFENVILLARPKSDLASNLASSSGTGTFGRLSFKKNGGDKARARRAKLDSASATHVLLYRLDLARCTIKELPTQVRRELPTDGSGTATLQSRFGFELKHVKRVTQQEQATGRSWLGRRGSAGSTKVSTVIEKFQVRVRNEPIAKTLLAAIGSLIVDAAAEAANGGESGVEGAKSGVRSWKKRTAGRTAIAKAPTIQSEHMEEESKTASNSA